MSDSDLDTQPFATRQGPITIAAVTMALLVFPIAFNLGAYRQVLYPDVFRIAVASFVLCGAMFVVPPYDGVQLWFTRIVLAAPTAWVVAAVLVVGSTAEATERPFFVAWLVAIMVVSVPVTLKMLIDMFSPELSSTHSLRLTLGVVVVVVVVAASGFLIGRHNDRVMTCDDFRIAGSSVPENCAL